MQIRWRELKQCRVICLVERFLPAFFLVRHSRVSG
jgi:hypothetical protein